MWKMEQYIRAIAGSFVLLSLVLGYLFSPYWHLFTAFVGLNLLQSAFTSSLTDQAGSGHRTESHLPLSGCLTSQLTAQLHDLLLKA